MPQPRNAPCPCGSGRKHKHCCLVTAATSPESPWPRIERLRATLKPANDMLVDFFRSHYGNDQLQLAWNAFWVWSEFHETFDPDEPHQQAFFSWLQFNWQHEPESEKPFTEDQRKPAPASVFLQRRGWQLGPTARAWFEACLERPFSLYEILETNGDDRLRLRDVLIGDEAEVFDRNASRALEKGQIVFARLVPFEQVFMLEAAGDALLPPRDKLEIMDLRTRMLSHCPDPTAELLREWETEIRDLFLDLAYSQLNPEMPILNNTDGDPLEMHSLRFAVENPADAFDALRHLDVIDGGSAAWAAAQGENGSLGPLEWHWSRPDFPDDPDTPHTYLARLLLEGSVLTVEVNSGRRARAIQEQVDAALANHARLLSDTIDDTWRTKSPRPLSDPDAEQQALLDTPEARAALIDYLHQHYDRWEDTALPILNGRTPRECLADPDGRERVLALIRDVEQRKVSLDPAIDREVVERLLRRLGLD